MTAKANLVRQRGAGGFDELRKRRRRRSKLCVFFKIVYRGVEESGRPRWSHKPEIVGSNPTPATKYKMRD